MGIGLAVGAAMLFATAIAVLRVLPSARRAGAAQAPPSATSPVR
jgi:hypothetical protein